MRSFRPAVYNWLFAGAESVFDEAFVRAAGEPDGLTRVLLEFTDDVADLDYLPWELARLGVPGSWPFEIVRSVPVAPKLAGQIPVLPFRVLVANMGLPHETIPTFPLRTVLLRIFGDPERLTKVFHPTTMSGIGRDELTGVLAQSRYEIVHLQLLTDWRSSIEGRGDGPPLTGEALVPLLERSQTRLLILHSRRQTYGWPDASQLVRLARSIVEKGGPAVLIVPFDAPDPAGGTVMLNEFYNRIVHDEPLDAALFAARTRRDSVSQQGDATVAPILMLGPGSENLLRLSPLAADLLRRTGESRNRVARLSRRMTQLSVESTLDMTGANNILANAGGMFAQSDRIAREIEDWSRETRGLMPLHEATTVAEQGQDQLQNVERAIERLEQDAARVVNFCFLTNGVPLSRDQSLVHKVPQQLRLQIGKPWLDSVVRNAQALPERYIEAHSDETGIDLDVCLYSEDFSLPEAGIFSLRLPRAPAASGNLDITVTPEKLGTARLRICIYYRRNLIQSLAVVASVTEGRADPRENANYAEIEFSMADTVIGVEELPPRTLNLLTNDSTDGTHKIAIRGTDIKLQYTLTGSTAITNVRKALFTICADVDAKGIPTKYHYSDDDNSGGEAKLVTDLMALAAVGSQLYTDLITRQTDLDQQDALEAKLKQPGEIQVAITSSARNVYPWAAIYDRKRLSGPGIGVCPVMLKKLTGADQAAKLHTNSCIDGGCPHASDIKMICPLGFWGFRHAIEQLPPNRGAYIDSIPARQPSLVMAVHQKLAGKVHCAEIEKESGLTPQYADLKATIGTALQSDKPHVVYFYCHGGHADDAPYLGVGNDEQIAPGDFVAWDTRWKDTTPMVVVNGCHTVDLDPNDLLDFVNTFAWCRAAGVIGTEIAIPELLAREFGRFFISRFAKGEKVAVIFRDFRLSLLAKRNVLGLCYTPYCHGDLHLTRS